MLNKILFTVFVASVVMGIARWRGKRAQVPLVNVTPPPQPAARPMPAWVRPAAYGFAAMVVVGSSLWYYSAWQDDQQIVIIRVINTGSGESATYQARKGSIDGRRFRTTDGFVVRVADAERIEVQAVD